MPSRAWLSPSPGAGPPFAKRFIRFHNSVRHVPVPPLCAHLQIATSASKRDVCTHLYIPTSMHSSMSEHSPSPRRLRTCPTHAACPRAPNLPISISIGDSPTSPSSPASLQAAGLLLRMQPKSKPMKTPTPGTIDRQWLGNILAIDPNRLTPPSSAPITPPWR